MSDALQIHADTLQDVAGECVTYVRGSQTIELECVPGESRFESVRGDGSVVEVRTEDFIVQQDAIDFGSGPTEPERKDKIVHTVNGVEKTYEVLPDEGIKHFRVTDSHGVGYRIHTKEKPE